MRGGRRPPACSRRERASGCFPGSRRYPSLPGGEGGRSAWRPGPAVTDWDALAAAVAVGVGVGVMPSRVVTRCAKARSTASGEKSAAVILTVAEVARSRTVIKPTAGSRETISRPSLSLGSGVTATGVGLGNPGEAISGGVVRERRQVAISRAISTSTQNAIRAVRALEPFWVGTLIALRFQLGGALRHGLGKDSIVPRSIPELISPRDSNQWAPDWQDPGERQVRRVWPDSPVRRASANRVSRTANGHDAGMAGGTPGALDRATA
jgi:hypothetical protein